MEKVRDLAKKERGMVGLMAVEVFDVLRKPSEQQLRKVCARFLTNITGDGGGDLKFHNILAYLGSKLWLDVEGGESTDLKDSDDSPPLAIDGG